MQTIRIQGGLAIAGLFAACLLAFGRRAGAQILRRRIPARVVVLSFDDAVRSDYQTVAPVLKRYGFHATFFVCEFPPDFSDSSKYMTWYDIGQLSRMGFEIGNHTRTHMHVPAMDSARFAAQLGYIEQTCLQHGIPRPRSFAYPAYVSSPNAIRWLRERGYLFARAGGGQAYRPLKDCPYLIPSFSTSGTDTASVYQALRQARAGQIVVLTIHGVPDKAHPWVTTPPKLFYQYMAYLHRRHYQVLSMEALQRYINPLAALKAHPGT